MSTNTNKFNFWNAIWTLIWICLLAGMVANIVFFQQVNVVGKSMYPNYDDEDRLLVNQVDKKFKRGQVVAVYEDDSIAKNANYLTRFKARFFLKRIIALPGEEVEVIGSKTIIFNSQYPDGAVLKEDYISTQVKNEEELRESYFKRTKVSKDHYFLMGDNRSNSTDSRVRGAFSDYSIFGQEVVRIWPFPKFDVFDLPSYEFIPIDNDLKTKMDLYENSQDVSTGKGFFN